MKLLLKHILKSIGKKPLQPLIIILTLALSMATSVFAFTISDTMEDELAIAQAAKYGNASFMVSVGNTSSSRFLFADDVIDVLGDSAKAVGGYELPLILKGTENTTVAIATEFENFCDVFDIDFKEYGTVTAGSLGEVAFISAEFASVNGLSIGDELTVETMGYGKTYRVEGITTHLFLASYDVMVDISSVVRIFAANSLLFSAIGEDFKPCNKVFVNVSDCEGIDQGEAIALLKSDARFGEKSFEDLAGIESRQVNYSILEVVITFAVSLASLLSAVVVFCCFYILANERTEENQAFVYSGASPKLLWGMQYAETVLYWLLGAPLGILLAIPITKLIPHFVGLQYVTVSIRGSAFLKSAFILLAVCVLTTTFFIVAGQRMRKKGAGHASIPSKWIVCLLLVLAVLFALMYLLPSGVRLGLLAITLAAIVILVFWSVPLLLRHIASAFEKRLKGSQKPLTIALRYALKNVCSLKLLHNIARLCALIVMIVLTIGLVLVTVEAQIQAFGQVFDADYAVFNATDQCYQKTETCGSAEDVSRAYLNQTGWGMVISAEDPAFYADWLNMDRQPKGNEIVVSVGLAHSHDLKIGDVFKLELDGVEQEFVVVEITDVCANYLAINCKDIGLSYNMLLVKGKEGVSQAQLLNDLSQATASDLAPIAEADTLLARFIAAINTYADAGKILLVVFIIFSLIGTVDIFYESLRARREEFGLYRLAGMSQQNLRRMKVAELIITLLFGLTIGLGAFVLSALAVNRGMTARSLEIFRGVLAFFR